MKNNHELLESGTSGFLSLAEVLHNEFETLHDDVDGKGGDTTSIFTGIKELDAMTHGLKRGDLIVIGSRPSVGKTSLAIKIVLHAAIENQLKVGMISMEMSAQQLATRMLHLYEQTVLIEKPLPLEDTLPILKADIFIDATAAISVVDICKKCRELHKVDNNLDMVVIDYLQLLRGDIVGKKSVQDIMVALKELALELNIPVLILSQLDRSVEKRGDKRPTLVDLRDLKLIEPYVDMIMFIHRDELFHQSPDNEGLAEIIIAKHGG